MVVAKISHGIYTDTYKITESALKSVTERFVVFKSRVDIGINDNRFLFVLQVTVLNLRDEGRRI